MALDTATKKTNRRLALRQKSRSLTLRILSVNIIAPLTLLIGLLYMGHYRTTLIANELQTLKVQVQMFAAALATNDDPQRIGQMVVQLRDATNNRILIFASDKKLIADSNQTSLLQSNDETNGSFLSYVFPDALEGTGEQAFTYLRQRNALPRFPTNLSYFLDGHFGIAGSFDGAVHTQAWDSGNGRLLLTAAAPMRRNGAQAGVVALIRSGQQIEKAMGDMRRDILRLFLGALTVTILLSLYLAAVIGRPLKKLALAAEAVQMGFGDKIDIPDLSHRGDEIGHLSVALRDMTRALKDRMSTIERFAADVAHELKNPLTSLRSAIETLERVKKDEDRVKLTQIVTHDLQRMDRLISDISRASRLDAELSRDEKLPVDLVKLLTHLIQSHERGQAGSRGVTIKLIHDNPPEHLRVRGQADRFSQIFDNLIANAVSFSPDNTTVTVHMRYVADSNNIEITISDQGPGIPVGKEENIFERFYSERPSHEGYGMHSGLGLSIVRQIVTAYNGNIFAENIIKSNGSVGGAKFTVTIPNNT